MLKTQSGQSNFKKNQVGGLTCPHFKFTANLQPSRQCGADVRTDTDTNGRKLRVQK